MSIRRGCCDCLDRAGFGYVRALCYRINSQPRKKKHPQQRESEHDAPGCCLRRKFSTRWCFLFPRGEVFLSTCQELLTAESAEKGRRGREERRNRSLRDPRDLSWRSQRLMLFLSCYFVGWGCLSFPQRALVTSVTARPMAMSVRWWLDPQGEDQGVVCLRVRSLDAL